MAGLRAVDDTITDRQTEQNQAMAAQPAGLNLSEQQLQLALASA